MRNWECECGSGWDGIHFSFLKLRAISEKTKLNWAAIVPHPNFASLRIPHSEFPIPIPFRIASKSQFLLAKKSLPINQSNLLNICCKDLDGQTSTFHLKRSQNG